MEGNLIRISKFLSLILRHKPETIGLTLDEHGWAQVDELLQKANETGMVVDKELLRCVVEQGDKKRFSFSEDGSKVRANYGHSLRIDLGLEPIEPPEYLFHGTASHFLVSIRGNGIGPKGRNYVHLSPDEQSAFEIGRRHGEPIVLTIQSRRMYGDGYQFFLSASGIWLTEAVSPEYIVFP